MKKIEIIFIFSKNGSRKMITFYFATHLVLSLETVSGAVADFGGGDARGRRRTRERAWMERDRR